MMQVREMSGMSRVVHVSRIYRIFVLDPHHAVLDRRHRAVDRGVDRRAEGRLAVGDRRPADRLALRHALADCRPPARTGRRRAASA